MNPSPRCKNPTPVIYISEGEQKVPASPIDNRSILSELGLIEFEDSELEDIKILVWGKATRYYPLDPNEYRLNGIARYLAKGSTTKITETAKT